MEEPAKTAIREPYEAPSVDDVPLQSSDMMASTCKTPNVGVAFNGVRGCHPGFSNNPCKNS